MDDTLVSAEQLDQITDRFKGEWNSGDTPKLEKYLTEVSEERRSHLLGELLPFELTSRRNRGEVPAHDAYLSSFPEDATVVNHCFSVSETEGTPQSRQRLIDTRTQAETDFANDTGPLPTAAEISGSTTDSELEPGHPKELGNFQIVKKIGEGGMGYVFEAKDNQLNRRVALKVMKREVATNASARKRFLREGRAVASLHDDHIIPIFQVGETDDIPFIAMPLLSGETLDERVKRTGSLSGPELLRVAREIALGLVAAHSNGVIHRDIKPSNLWLEEPHGRIKILDFGLAQMDEESQALTVTGSFIGTPMYMSPEQADGLRLDDRSDLFSFGAVLYFAATGESPFRRSTLTATLHAIGYEEPAIPHTINEGIPETLSGYIMWLLSKSPEDRPSSMTGVLGHLDLIAVEGLPADSPEENLRKVDTEKSNFDDFTLHEKGHYETDDLNTHITVLMQEAVKACRPSPPRVLWIDIFFPSNNNLVCRLLDESGCLVDHALTLEEAVKLISVNHYLLIVSDMGNADHGSYGVKLLRNVKHSAPRTPIIAFSSQSEGDKSDERIDIMLYTFRTSVFLDAVLQVFQRFELDFAERFLSSSHKTLQDTPGRSEMASGRQIFTLNKYDYFVGDSPFEFYGPLFDEAVSRFGQTPPAILWQDFDESSIEPLVSFLTEAGCSVYLVESTEETIEWLQSYEANLVISDIGIEDGEANFVDMLNMTQQESVNTAVIAYTSRWASAIYNEQLCDRGALLCTSKPSQLFDAILQILEQLLVDPETWFTLESSTGGE
jgi:serine/threonine protein kinase